MAGPRYTRRFHTWIEISQHERSLQFFGEGLFGRTHSFDGVFPASSGVTSSENALYLRSVYRFKAALHGLRRHPLICMLLKIRSTDDSSPT